MLRLSGFAFLGLVAALASACKMNDTKNFGASTNAAGTGATASGAKPAGGTYDAYTTINANTAGNGGTQGFAPAALVGSWVTPCTQSPDGSTSGITTTTFTGNMMTLSTLAYSNGSCQNTPSPPIVQMFNYTLGQASSVAANTMEYDLTEIVDGKAYPDAMRYSLLQVQGNSLTVGQNDGQGHDGTSAAKRFAILGALIYTRK